MKKSTQKIGFRAAFLDCIDDPFYHSEKESIRYIPDGLMIVEQGIIKDFGAYQDLSQKYTDIPITSYKNHLILPGFIDLHVHYPQTEMIAAYGEQLLGWLNKYTFPTEAKFKNPEYAQKIATFFLEELLRNGTTTALVLTAVFSESVNAFFQAAEKRNLRMIAGKVMMDRNAPENLLDTAKTSYEESQKLIQRWHQKDRLLYAVTPRFAITSTPEQLTLAGRLIQEYPNVYLHTHLSENKDELKFTAELYPDCADYLEVYEQFDLVSSRSIFAHGIYLSDSEFNRLSQAQSTIAFCPTSNLFIGSGLFKLNQAKSNSSPIAVGLGTDVGAGSSFSILRTAHEAYKVTHLQGTVFSGLHGLFLATLGGAKSLSLDDKIGNFEIGKEADFIVINPQSTPLMQLRTQNTYPAKTLEDIADIAFVLMMLGDDRVVHATYILGELAYQNPQDTAV